MLEKWDVLGAVLRSCPWPEGDFPQEDVEEDRTRVLKEKGGGGGCSGRLPALHFWSPLLPVAGRPERCRAWSRLEVTDGWAESCVLERVLCARPRAGPGTLTTCHPIGARESVCHEGYHHRSQVSQPFTGTGEQLHSGVCGVT